MTTEIQEKFGDHITPHKPKSHGGAANDRAVDEGGGGCAASPPTITTTTTLESLTPSPHNSSYNNMSKNDAGAHECSSSSDGINGTTEVDKATIKTTPIIQHSKMLDSKLTCSKAKAINGGKKCQQQLLQTSDAEEGFLSTSPDSANEELLLSSTAKSGELTTDHTSNCANGHSGSNSNTPPLPPPFIYTCNNPKDCVNIKHILESFKAPLSEEQAWALLFQFISLYRRVAATGQRHIFNDLEVPEAMDNMSLHRDGSVHCSWSEAERKKREQALRELRQHQQEAEQSGK